MGSFLLTTQEQLEISSFLFNLFFLGGSSQSLLLLNTQIVKFAHTKPSIAVHIFSRVCVTKSRWCSSKAMPVLHRDTCLLCTSH